MAYTREQWARDFLASIGNNNPTPNVVNWVVGWTSAETAAGRTASYNLLNTTLQNNNVTGVWNSVGVKEYNNYASGIQANAATLENGQYSSLLAALQSNNETALGIGQNSPSAGVLTNLNTWCGNCGYRVNNLLGVGGSDTFAGTAQPISSPGLNLQSFLPSCASDSSSWWCYPVTQAYGVPEANLGVGGTHSGIDLGTPLGTKITAIEPGTIVAAGPQKWGGDVLEAVQSGGQTIYQQFLHLEEINVKPGQSVNAGDLLGLTGGTSTASPIPTYAPYSSGPHIHFAEYSTGLPEQWGISNSIDPSQLISQLGKGQVASGNTATLGSTTSQTCTISIPMPMGLSPICIDLSGIFGGFDFKTGALRTGLVLFGAILILVAIGAMFKPSINISMPEGGKRSGYSGNEEITSV